MVQHAGIAAMGLCLFDQLRALKTQRSTLARPFMEVRSSHGFGCVARSAFLAGLNA